MTTNTVMFLASIAFMTIIVLVCCWYVDRCDRQDEGISE